MVLPVRNAWLSPPSDLTLSRDDVHVWRASLDLSGSQVETLGCGLSADERARGDRYRFPRDHDRFIVARSTLRSILGRYLGAEPGDLCFTYSRYGKPAVAGPFRAHPLTFNLSHSHGTALYAVACHRRIGIDLEHIRADLDSDQLGQRFFSPAEAAVLRSLTASDRRRAFFSCWTRKEAFIKARGNGLALPLDQFEVSVHPDQPARLLSIQGEPHEAGRWSLRDVCPGSDYVAALAVEGHGWHLSYWQWMTQDETPSSLLSGPEVPIR